MNRSLRWETGRIAIDALLEKKYLEQVAANVEHAELLIERARRHVASAVTLRDDDPDQALAARLADTLPPYRR